MRENNKENHVLKVQMFGTFTMNYGGKPLVMKRSRRNNQLKLPTPYGVLNLEKSIL